MPARGCDDAGMRDFEDSTLWRVSEYERVRLRTGSSGFARLDGPTVLPTTLLADLRRLDADGTSDDPLKVLAACMRHHEPALLCLQCDGLVWPITVFPWQMLYHSPRDITQVRAAALSRATLLSAEPPTRHRRCNVSARSRREIPRAGGARRRRCKRIALAPHPTR